MAKKRLFRQNQDELGNSPDQLQDYVRVTNPIVWVVLVAVILLLGGGAVAATLGKVEVTLNAAAFVTSGTAYMDVATPDANKLKEGMTVRFTGQGASAQIAAIEWLTPELAEATFAIALPDTTDHPYPCVVVTDVVSPISFLIN